MGKGIEGKVVLITGGSTGIGAAVARRLAASGAKVAVAARRKDKLDEVVAAIVAEGGAAKRTREPSPMRSSSPTTSTSTRSCFVPQARSSERTLAHTFQRQGHAQDIVRGHHANAALHTRAVSTRSYEAPLVVVAQPGHFAVIVFAFPVEPGMLGPSVGWS
ncbi:hypothetical protein LMG27177_07441 [Paraburkholderia fynbosensis]|uniref:SDR family NAD(P)-dependent oxidoreductase n=1 Tax=Paraburkholderia fynbosensis TaxID=1200993 RepID=A0A6J5H1G3_9BURK|nr:SDR family NAD(P)-dependent oxidoreductase [Paraburkholderia fynbosensis]CAB3810757.1 hypothetical protein LMG27177_07441 [Paraburkholderia fynbosensis]